MSAWVTAFIIMSVLAIYEFYLLLSFDRYARWWPQCSREWYGQRCQLRQYHHGKCRYRDTTGELIHSWHDTREGS